MLEGYEEDTDGFWDYVPKAALPITREDKRHDKLRTREEFFKEKDKVVKATKALETQPDSGYSFQELQEFLLPPGPRAIVTMEGYEFLFECDFRSVHEAHKWKKARNPFGTCIDFWDMSQMMHKRRLLTQAAPGDYYIAPNKGRLDANGMAIACPGFGIYTKQGFGHCDWPRHDYNPNVVPLQITTVEP